MNPTKICCRRISNGLMTAWQVVNHQHGLDPASGCMLLDAKFPVITRPDEILIKVKAASLNPIDLRMTEGYGRNVIDLMRRIDHRTIYSPNHSPLILGRDCCGVVAEIGRNVKKFKSGDEVWCSVGAEKQGCFAQYTLATEDLVSKKPKDLSDVEAASMPYVACTVWSALCNIARLHTVSRNGLSTLIHAGSGGVGTFAVQLAKAYNARVTATCKPDAEGLLKRLGADNVVDYASPDAFDKLSESGPYDIILDPVNTDLSKKSIKLLGLWRGCVCVNICNPLLSNTDELGLGAGFAKSALQFGGQFVEHALDGRLSVWGFVMPSGQILDTVRQLIESDQIEPVIDDVFTFDNLPEAMKKLASGQVRGKVVIRMP